MPPRRVNVFFTPPPPDRLAGRTAIVIDTLRATTTLLTLIVAGADAVYPTASDADAFALAKTLPGARLCGERDGRRVPGFDFGNSPLELLHAGVAGETFIQSTSNGTRALTIAGPRAAKPTAGRSTHPSSPASATAPPPPKPASRQPIPTTIPFAPSAAEGDPPASPLILRLS